MSGQGPKPKGLVLRAAGGALVAFNAVIPLMTVVNYSVQETFGDNLFFWRAEVVRGDPALRALP
jgi:hypothetical protein